jgi:hypothetical protein
MEREPTGNEGADMKAITCYSAVDWWIVLILLSPVLYGVYLLLAGDPRIDLRGIVEPLAVILLLASLIFPIRYTLTNRSLLIRCGLIGIFYKQEIPLEKIQSVYLTYNPIAGPAWSIKRIGIDYEGSFWGFTLISPKDRQAFMEELNRRRTRCR